MKTLITRRYSLSLVHQIPAEFVGDLCANLHGHYFKVDVTVEGDMPIAQLDEAVEQTILRPYRAKALSALQSQQTGEAISREFLALLQASALGQACRSVQLTETRKNRFQSVTIV